MQFNSCIMYYHKMILVKQLQMEIIDTFHLHNKWYVLFQHFVKTLLYIKDLSHNIE